MQLINDWEKQDMSFLIRRYNASDQGAVIRLHIEGLTQFSASIGNPKLDLDIHNIEQHYLMDGGDFIVLESQNVVIGMGGLRKRNKETAEIKRIRIDITHQRKGYGRIILEELGRIAKEKGIKRLVLDTTANQVPAQKLFSSCGYVETSRRLISGMEIIYYEKNI